MFMHLMKKTLSRVQYMLHCTNDKQKQCTTNIFQTMLDLQDNFIAHPVEKLQYSFEQLHSIVHCHP